MIKEYMEFKGYLLEQKELIKELKKEFKGIKDLGEYRKKATLDFDNFIKDTLKDDSVKVSGCFYHNCCNIDGINEYDINFNISVDFMSITIEYKTGDWGYEKLEVNLENREIVNLLDLENYDLTKCSLIMAKVKENINSIIDYAKNVAEQEEKFCVWNKSNRENYERKIDIMLNTITNIDFDNLGKETQLMLIKNLRKELEG